MEDESRRHAPQEKGLHPDDRILAELAIKQRLANHEQIREAVAMQLKERRLGREAPLGQILVSRGILSPRQLELLDRTRAYLTMRQPDRTFGQAVVRNGLVSEAQVEEAFRQQARLYKETLTYRALGDLLVEAGLLTARQRETVHAAIERLRQKNSTQASPKPPEKTASTAPAPQPSGMVDVRSLTGTVLLDATSFELVVTDDRMLAFARVKQPLPPEVTADSLLALLISRGITTGVFGEEAIEAALRADQPLPKLVRLAQGNPPQPGRPAQIRYGFERAPSESGETNETVPVTLKRWAEIPHVRSGECIAEILPGMEGQNGVDVYGGPIPVEPITERKILCGKGVVLSRNGLKAIASVDGRPHRSFFDRISVHPELTVEGDVSFETGNIDFDGDIIVRGVIQDGFRVKGATITAREISKAQVEASGDVLVQGGILGATIRAQGNVSAIHIHASRIEAQGNVAVERGIVDSQIQLAGKCLAQRGTIMASTIVARQGIEAYQVGSDRSGACTLIVGADAALDKQITDLREAAATAETAASRVKETLNAESRQLQKLELRIGELAQVQDRALREQRALTAQPGGPAQAQSTADELSARISEAERELEGLFTEETRIKETIADLRAQFQDRLQGVQQAKDELAAIAQWLSRNPVVPSVKVFGTIHAGNTVQGNGTVLTFPNDCRAVHIKESPLLSPDGTPGTQRKLQVHRLN